MDILKLFLLTGFLSSVIALPTNLQANEAYRSLLTEEIIGAALKKSQKLSAFQSRTAPSVGSSSTGENKIRIERDALKAFSANPLSQAVDNLDFNFVSGDGAGFFKQEKVYNLDCDAAQSASIPDDSVAIMITGAVGPTEVSFDWKVSSEARFDGLAFSILRVDQNGNLFDTGIGTSIDGDVDWNRRFFQVPSGPHILAWGYVKDGSASRGKDAGWVDQVLIGRRGQITPDLENPDGCNLGAAALPAILQILLDDSEETTPPVDLPDDTTPPLPTEFDGQFILKIESDEGDTIGRGQSFTYLQKSTLFSFSSNFDGGISLTLNGFSEENHGTETDWNLDLASNNSRLSVGVYQDATRFPFQDNNGNGLKFSGNGRSCRTLNGQFRIFEVEYDIAGDLTKLIADFEQFCSNSNAALRGSLNFDSSKIADEIQVIEPLPQDAVITPALPADFEGQFALRFESDPEDFIGQGQTLTYFQQDILFDFTTNFDNGISLQFNGSSQENPDRQDNWSLDLASMNSRLTTGLYQNATRWPFNNFNGLDFSGNGSGCNRLRGQFRIFEVEYDIAGDLTKLTADFEQFCENSSASLRGSLSYDSSEVSSLP